ncbi:hypothetical protein [Streptomyces sp. NPDC004435]|uniref:DUF6197 family protein n=1 Tax=Streptomyces sp. NPDC004435 TaxID=3364701 RepID=UPI00367A6942
MQLTIDLTDRHVRTLSSSDTWYGLSGARLTGDAVARHIEAAARHMRDHGWDPHLHAPSTGHSLYHALVHTAEDGHGDDDTRRAADEVLGAVLCALTGAPYVYYESWSEHTTRTLDDITHACELAAAVARHYGPTPEETGR